MYTSSQLINGLQLNRHPEGGYFRETYRSKMILTADSLPDSFEDPRHISTSIYFLLPSGERSLFHRIKSDEIWNFHFGSSLSIYVLENEKLSIHKLGPDLNSGEKFQVVVPANSWFGAICNESDSFTLSGCSVAPGFDFADFELADRNKLMTSFPMYREAIELLTKP